MRKFNDIRSSLEWQQKYKRLRSGVIVVVVLQAAIALFLYARTIRHFRRENSLATVVVELTGYLNTFKGNNCIVQDLETANPVVLCSDIPLIEKPDSTQVSLGKTKINTQEEATQWLFSF